MRNRGLGAVSGPAELPANLVAVISDVGPNLCRVCVPRSSSLSDQPVGDTYTTPADTSRVQVQLVCSILHTQAGESVERGGGEEGKTAVDQVKFQKSNPADSPCVCLCFEAFSTLLACSSSSSDSSITRRRLAADMAESMGASRAVETPPSRCCRAAVEKRK